MYHIPFINPHLARVFAASLILLNCVAPRREYSRKFCMYIVEVSVKLELVSLKYDNVIL